MPRSSPMVSRNFAGRIAEGLGHLGRRLLVGGAQGAAVRSLSWPVVARMRSNCSPMARGRRLRRCGQDGADLARLGFGVLERALDEGREGAGDGFEILRAVADAGEKRVQGLLAAGERLVHARLDTLQGRGGFGEGAHLLAGVSVSARPRSSRLWASSSACWMAPEETLRSAST